MIKSQYILDVLDLTFDDHKESSLLRKQVEFLTIRDTEHTGVGLYINFSSDKSIQDYKINGDLLSGDANGNDILEMVTGLEIVNEKQNILADATVHLKNGIIDCLEIWNKNGGDYPLTDPEHYELNQSWRDETEKRMLKK